MATLWAISDLHTGHTGNKPVTESLHPSSPDDWLIVAGDVAERTDEIRWALDLLRKRFAKVIWVPGNHELWTTEQGPRAGVRPGPLRLPGQHVRRDGRSHPRASVSGVDRGGRAGHHRADVPALRLHVPARRRGHEGRGPGHRQGPQRGRHRRVRAVQRAVRDEGRVVPRSRGGHPQAARGPRLGDADGSGQPLPAGARALRGAVLSRSSRCGAGPPRPPTGTPATTRSARCTGICTFPARRGTTACASRRCRSATRESGGAASRIAGCARCCPTRSTRPATSTSSAGTSRSRRRCGRTRRRCRSASPTGSRHGRDDSRDTAFRRAAGQGRRRRDVHRPTGSGAAAGGGAADRAVGGQAPQRVHHRPLLRAAGAGGTGCAAGPDPEGGEGRTVLAGRRGGQPHPLRRVPRCGGRPPRRRPLGRHRRRTPRRAARTACSTRSACPPSGRELSGASWRSALGSNPVLRQGGDVQGVVPAHPPLAGLRGRPHRLRRRRARDGGRIRIPRS